jgi:hypothetical protein
MHHMSASSALIQELSACEGEHERRYEEYERRYEQHERQLRRR